MTLGTVTSTAFRRVTVTLLGISALVYNDWLLQFVVPTGLSQANSYVSETFAADQPYRVLFSSEELACAGVIIAAALGGCQLARGRLARAGWAAMVGFGMFSVADVLLPMQCAPSVDPYCTESPAHATTSALVHFALFSSMFLFVLAARQDGAGLPLLRRWAQWLLPVSMAAAISSVGPFFGYPGGQGIAQRIHLVTVGVWFMLLATELARAHTSAEFSRLSAPARTRRRAHHRRRRGAGRPWPRRRSAPVA
jgi:hypothetical protein